MARNPGSGVVTFGGIQTQQLLHEIASCCKCQPPERLPDPLRSSDRSPAPLSNGDWYRFGEKSSCLCQMTIFNHFYHQNTTPEKLPTMNLLPTQGSILPSVHECPVVQPREEGIRNKVYFRTQNTII